MYDVCSNPGFEADILGWTKSSPASITLARVTSEQHSGAASGQVVTDGTVANQRVYWDTGGDYVLETNDVVTVRCWVKAASGTVGIRAATVDAAAYQDLSSYSTAVMDGTWQQIEAQVTATSDTDSVRCEIGIPSGSVALTFYVDDVEILVPERAPYHSPLRTANGTTSAAVDFTSYARSGAILVIACESTDSATAAGTPNTPSGFSKIFEETQAAGATGVTTLTIFVKDSDGTETSVTVDGVTDHLLIYGFVVYETARASDIIVGTGNGADTGNGTVTGITTDKDYTLVVPIVATTHDVAGSASFSGWANAGLAGLIERGDAETSTGAGGGLGIAFATDVAAGSTGDTTVTIAVSDKWRSVHLGFPPALFLYTILNGSDQQLVNVNADGVDIDPLSYKDGVALSDAELVTLLNGTSFGQRNIAVMADQTGDAAKLPKKLNLDPALDLPSE